jgi:hypothetical protein
MRDRIIKDHDEQCKITNMDAIMTDDERQKKIQVARERYGKPFIHERPMPKPGAKPQHKSVFQFQRRNLNP